MPAAPHMQPLSILHPAVTRAPCVIREAQPASPQSHHTWDWGADAEETCCQDTRQDRIYPQGSPCAYALSSPPQGFSSQAAGLPRCTVPRSLCAALLSRLQPARPPLSPSSGRPGLTPPRLAEGSRRRVLRRVPLPGSGSESGAGSTARGSLLAESPSAETG